MIPLYLRNRGFDLVPEDEKPVSKKRTPKIRRKLEKQGRKNARR